MQFLLFLSPRALPCNLSKSSLVTSVQYLDQVHSCPRRDGTEFSNQSRSLSLSPFPRYAVLLLRAPRAPAISIYRRFFLFRSDKRRIVARGFNECDKKKTKTIREERKRLVREVPRFEADVGCPLLIVVRE